MAPVKNKKKNSAAAKSTSKHADSDKEPLKKGETPGNAAESTSKQTIPNKKAKEDEKSGDEKESTLTPVAKKPCTWLKLDKLNPQSGSKTSQQSGKQANEAKSHSQVQTERENKRKRPKEGEERDDYDPNHGEKHSGSRVEEKEKGIMNSRHKETTKVDDESDRNLGGLIFMCNAKTKPDCFKYQVLGVPSNKKEIVESIKPGLKLFLYDYDAKLMYGVYEASSAGGMKLEPTAFGGGFPAQVRFIVHKDCIPLPESMFKKAIKDSYDEKSRKFKTALTVKQVKHLMGFFQPTPRLHLNGKQVSQQGDLINCSVLTKTLLGQQSIKGQNGPNNYGTSDARDPLFVTEQEYRSFGLRQGRHMPQTAGSTAVPNKLDQELKQLLKSPAPAIVDSSLQQREVNPANPFFLSEKEYRIFGLRARQQVANAASPIMKTNEYDPYDESMASLVNRYLALPMTTAIPAESYPMAGREPLVTTAIPAESYPMAGRVPLMTTAVPAEPYPRAGREPLMTTAIPAALYPTAARESYSHNVNHTTVMQILSRRTIPDGERAFTAYSLGEQSDFNQRQYSLHASREPSVFSREYSIQREPDLTSAPVSQRYSFAGPSPSQHR